MRSLVGSDGCQLVGPSAPLDLFRGEPRARVSSSARPIENAADFEKPWLGRNSRLKELPGFVQFHRLKGPEENGAQLYASHRIGESEDAFRNWTRSQQFRDAHAGAGETRKLHRGSPRFEGFTAIQENSAAKA